VPIAGEGLHPANTLCAAGKPNQREITMINTEGSMLVTLWPLVRERTIPTERPPLVDEI
jgi:hypothetical protein